MIFPVVDLLQDADGFVCRWRDGELYIEPAHGEC